MNFALGLERFSVADHQPHAPGYILYIAAGRLFQAFLGNPNSALEALSLIGGAAAIAGIFLVGRSIFDRGTGLVAATLLLFSPLDWFYSEIALPYGFKLLLVMAVTWFVYQLVNHKRYSIAASIVLGIAAGFRQDILLFMGPFWLFGSLRLGRRRMLLAWAALGVSILIWLSPLIYLEGGLTAYRQVISDQFSSGVQPSSVFADGFGAFKTNVKRVLQAIFWMFGPACIGLLYPAGLFLLTGRDRPEVRKTAMLLAFLVPAFCFFILFLFDPLGYLLVYVTPLLLLVARGFTAAAGAINAKRAQGQMASLRGVIALIALMALISSVNTYLFMDGATIEWRLPTTGPLNTIFESYSADGVKRADGELRQTVDDVRRYNPGNTVVVTSTVPFTPFIADWRRLMYYLPEYTVIMVRTDPWSGFLSGVDHTFIDSGSRMVPLPAGARRLLLLEKHLPEEVSAPVTSLNSSGTDLFMSEIEVPPDGEVVIGKYRFATPAPPAGKP